MKLLSTFYLLCASVHGASGHALWAHFPTPPTIDVQATHVAVPKSKITAFEHDLNRNIDFISTFENTQEDWRFGLNVDWMEAAIDMWKINFSWRQAEAGMNRHPHFIANITSEEDDLLHIHFMALFSHRKDAIPITFLHGWPGSFLEFMPVLDIIKEQYSPETSPYHIIVPSLPGFTFSSGPPVESDWKMRDTATVVDKLMRGIGFEAGYVAQGGDIGSLIAQSLASTSKSCKAVHLNFIPSIQPDSVPDPQNDTSLTSEDRLVLARSQKFVETEQAYALEQGSKPGTLSFVLSSHPFSLLAWLGEKFITWSDAEARLELDSILTHIALYQLTDTISRSLYSYRETSYSITPNSTTAPHIPKPFGYSRFPYDNSGVPKTWAMAMGDLVFFKDHDKGGHFAAMELPQELWDDVEAFIRIVFPDGIFLQDDE